MTTGRWNQHLSNILTGQTDTGYYECIEFMKFLTGIQLICHLNLNSNSFHEEKKLRGYRQ